MTISEQERITHEALQDVLSENVAAIRVKGFYNEESCATLSQRILQSSLYGSYANPGAGNIGRIGQAFYENQTSSEAKRRYESDGVRWVQQLRNEMAPYLTPIDKLRLEMDELWPYGASIGTLNGKKMFVGLARVFGEGSYAEPHQDAIAWDAPDSHQATTIEKQLTANIYLSLPEKGGELMIWPQSLTREEYERNRISGSYGVHEECLAIEPFAIRPDVGELVIFNPGKVHAVRRIERGNRISWSCFIGVRRPPSPLTLWS